MDDNIRNILRSYWLPLGLGLVGLIFLVYGVIGFLEKKEDSADILFETPEQSATVSAKQRQLAVDVEGAVFKPGVYRLPVDARVQDALIAAGGMNDEADREAVARRMNLASRVVDGGKIYIPRLGEAGQAGGQGDTGDSGQAGMTGELVDVNSASEAELDELAGVGPATAKKIIENRPYQSIDELVAKKAVGASLFGKIKDKIMAQ